MSIATDLRHADALTLLNRLNELNARKVDVFHPASAMQVRDGKLVLTDVLTEDGAWQRITLDLSDTFVQGLANKLSVPVAYLRRCLTAQDARTATDHVGGAPVYAAGPIFDQTVNFWLAQVPGKVLIRAYAGDAGTGLARAFLSDQFLTVDNLDMATAVFQGIEEAGVQATLIGADLTDTGMWMNFRCPDVAVDGGEFTRNYTHRPRGGHTFLRGADRPLIEAGFMVRNSEVGAGKAEIVPRLIVQVCTNGLTQNIDARGAIHLTKRQEQGIVWSNRTNNTRIELIKSEMADAVRHFTTTSYVQTVVDRINQVASVEVARPEKAIGHVAKMFTMPEERREALFAAFMTTGMPTVGGIVQAMTDLANEISDAGEAHELESQAEKVLAAAGAVAAA